MKFIAVLGRQPEISIAELEAIFGGENVQPIISELSLVETDSFNISRLGGTQKVARVIDQTPIDYLSSLPEGKITLGISDYRRGATNKTAQREAIALAQKLEKLRGKSVRVVPNHDGATISTATTLHNSIGGRNPRKVELLITERYTAIVSDVQNITSYARRDQQRPARDARVGMLPPKLAQILINLAAAEQTTGRVLDPFCGTGVVLQESLLMGYSAYGTDLEPRMIDYSQRNLDWLRTNNKDFALEVGDATTYRWTQPIDFVASETYLGQAFSAPPSDIKLQEVKHVTKHILTSFLKNLHGQIQPGTQLALAIPAWRRPDGSFSHLNILDELDRLGYNLIEFRNLAQKDLLYYREGQVVAREILVLRSK
jgi:tRNA G10  N-methylase Trm11